MSGKRSRPVHLRSSSGGNRTKCGHGGVTFSAPITDDPAQATCGNCLATWRAIQRDHGHAVASTSEWHRIEIGRPCPFLACLIDAPHEHPICPECGAVRYGNMSCQTCRDLRGSDLNPHRLVAAALEAQGGNSTETGSTP
jgi:hypothetical protein